MVSVTLSLSDQVKKEMDRFREINWSGFIRKSILAKTQELSWKEHARSMLGAELRFTTWAVQAQRNARMQRFDSLKRINSI